MATTLRQNSLALRAIGVLSLALWLGLALAPVRAESKKVIHPWENLLQNTGASFTGTNALYHIGAVGSTAGIVYSGADEAVLRTFRKHNPLGGTITADTAAIVGSFWHIAPAAAMYGYGLQKDNSHLATAGAAGLQAVGLTVAVVQVEKFVTGRRAPIKGDPNAGFADYKRSDDPTDFDPRFWQFGANRSGRHIWPSGHTATAAAFTAAMHAYYQDPTWAWVGYPLTLLMGLAMIEGDFHWASDVVAGALTGLAIGYTVGSNFRKRHNGHSSAGRRQQSQLTSLDLAARPGGWGLRFGYAY